MGIKHLLAPDRVHLLADDLDRLLVHPLAEGRKVTRPALTWRMYPPRTSSRARRLSCVRRRLAQGRQKELGRSVHHRSSTD